MPLLPAPNESAGASKAVFVAVVLLVLAGALLPRFVSSWADYPEDFSTRVLAWLTGTGDKDADTRWWFGTVWAELLKEMLHPLLLPAFGFLLLLQRRSADLSVWTTFYLGAAVGAAITAAGAHPLWALGGVLGTGLIVGTINAAVTTGLRAPAWLVSLGTATAGISVVWAILGRTHLRLANEQLVRWSGAGNYMLLVLVFLAAGIAMMWALGGRNAPPEGDPKSRWGTRARGRGLGLAMVASAVLSALGGVCWLAKSGEAPSPSWIIGDLRVVAAAVLAGGFAITTRSTRLLAAAFLPLAMLLATVWRQMVLDLPTVPCAVNLLVLAGMAGTAQAALLSGRGPQTRATAFGDPARPVRWAWAILAAAGLVVLAASGGTAPLAARELLVTAGMACWAVALVGAGWERIHSARGLTPGVNNLQ